MRIGPIELVNNLFVAPMAGVTDRPDIWFLEDVERPTV